MKSSFKCSNETKLLNSGKCPQLFCYSHFNDNKTIKDYEIFVAVKFSTIYRKYYVHPNHLIR